MSGLQFSCLLEIKTFYAGVIREGERKKWEVAYKVSKGIDSGRDRKRK